MLESAPTLNGPWTPVPGGASPLRITSGEADALLMIGLLSVNEDNIAATAMLIRAGRLYRAVGAIQWHRKALTLAQRVR